MKLVCISDLHGDLPQIPSCDLVLLGGDYRPLHMSSSEARRWYEQDFSYWLDELPAQHVVGVAGNHDFVFENHPEVAAKLPWEYLQDEAIELLGLKIWGSPWQPWFGGWAFNAPRGDLKEEWLKEKYSAIPDDVDIIISHGPPLNYGDRTDMGSHVGSKAFAEAILRVKPRLVVTGHIHPAYGLYRLGDTEVVNAARVDHNYKPYNSVVEVSLDASS